MASSSLMHVCMNNNSLPDDLLDLPDLGKGTNLLFYRGFAIVGDR